MLLFANQQDNKNQQLSNPIQFTMAIIQNELIKYLHSARCLPEDRFQRCENNRFEKVIYSFIYFWFLEVNIEDLCINILTHFVVDSD